MEKKKPAGLELGLVIGLIAGLIAGLWVGAVWTNKKARTGWNLRPVVVVIQDVPEGTALTFDHLSQRSVPEQFVTGSLVLPDSATDIIHKKLRVPLKAGDPLHWSYFETSSKTPAPEAQPVGSDSAR